MKSGSPLWYSCGQALSTMTYVRTESSVKPAVTHTPHSAAAIPGTSTIPGDHAELPDGVGVGHRDRDEQHQRRDPADADAADPHQLVPVHGVGAPGVAASHRPSEARARAGRILSCPWGARGVRW
ncbi:hypothetical protein SFUMM280S_03292 [Streptomyces fumanus]